MLVEAETCVGEEKKTQKSLLIEKQFLKKQDMNKSFSNGSKYSG